MKNRIFSAFLVACGAAICLATFSGPALSVNVGKPESARMPDVPAVPPNAISLPARPAIMLNMSRDHQLFYKAYNEFSDYQGDGIPDGGYIHSLSKPYYGYFDPGKCYFYNSAGGLFSPLKWADNNYFCDGNTWSGNFLNWATMTRIDVVRKVLYGGYRRTDDQNRTILERASLPMDAHSFAKHYKSSGGGNRPPLNKITPHDVAEITICNTTVDDNNAWSHSTQKPPLMRVVKGNFSLWSAHERRQCQWKEENNIWDSPGEPNGNDKNKTSYPAEPDYPARPTGTNYGDLVVRVEVCNSDFLGGGRGGERCRQYPNGKWKPVGLLQEFGEKDQVEFGLFTGSYSNNIQGGILRKNISSFKNEVDLNTGIFRPGVNGIVENMNKLRIFGHRYADGIYVDEQLPYIKSASVDYNYGKACNPGTIGLTNGKCISWGNPIGEMFIEALRYFKGLQPSAEYGNNRDKIGSDYLKLPDNVNWEDPLASSKNVVFGKPHCRSMNIVNFNASVISYDRDNLGPFGDLGAAKSLAAYVDEIGLREGVHGKSGFVGSMPQDTNNLCTAKNINQLSSVEGLCPYGPAYKGSFSLAGAAYWAHTHSLRNPVTTGVQAFKDPNFRVNTYSVALAPGVPRIVAKGPGDERVIIQPAYRMILPGGSATGSGALVDFRVISQSAKHGKYLVIWEDSEQGSDHDQDMAGFLEWSVDGNQIHVTTSVYRQSTPLTQGFGYTISGTNKNGAHFHSGVRGFKFDDPTGAPTCPNTTGCNEGDAATTASYIIDGSAGGVLQDPMYWAAKWGGFTVSSASDVPTTNDGKSNWDIRRADGDLGADGVPDNYFVVFNPSHLESAIRRAFRAIITKSNAAMAVSSSQLITGSSKYVAEFTSEDPIGGNVKAFSLNSDGFFKSNPDWTMGEILSKVSHGDRKIITNFKQGGLNFTWDGIDGEYGDALKIALKTKMQDNPTDAVQETRAKALVNYVRGDRSNEGGGFDWRLRPEKNILGTVVNAAPWLQLPPSASYFNATTFAGYSEYARSNLRRKKLLWAASNDGMVHGVEADNGSPVISFVPGVLVPRLVEQIESKDGVVPFVDGSPFTGDVRLGSDTTPGAWKTYLFGSLGRGGRAFYALDVTTPGNLNADDAASIFKWQFTAEDDPDLGYVLSDYTTERSSGQASPIVKLNNGKFAIITGNGYQSQYGKAALMILPVDGPDKNSGSWNGNRYYKIVADPDGANGLSTPTWVDTDNNGTADFVYAGDLKGRLWKFDISESNPSKWQVSFSAKGCGDISTDASTCDPLYDRAAGDQILPITTAPKVILGSTAGWPDVNYAVTFGTGASYDDGLFPTSNTNRIYGIYDRSSFGGGGGRSLPRGTATLLQRKYERLVDGKVTVDWILQNNKPIVNGWYADLPGTSEMIVSNPIRLAQYVAMVSVRPYSDLTSCSGLPDATLFIVNPVTGLPPMVSETNYLFGMQNRKPVAGISIADQKVSIALDKTPRGASSGLESPSGRSVKFRVMGNGIDDSATDILGNLPDSESRLQWREIPGLRTR